MKIKYVLVLSLGLACGVLAGSANLNGSIHARDGSALTNGLAGVTIELLASNGTVRATTQTDVQGQFVFSNAVDYAGVRMKASHANYVLQVNEVP